MFEYDEFFHIFHSNPHFTREKLLRIFTRALNIFPFYSTLTPLFGQHI